MTALAVGDRVTMLREVRPWYSGYGANPEVVLPAGTVGEVTHVDVPAVRAVRGCPATYVVLSFVHRGERWQTSVYARDHGETWRRVEEVV